MINKKIISTVLSGCLILGGTVPVQAFHAAEARYNKGFYSDFDTDNNIGVYNGGETTALDDAHGSALKLSAGAGRFYSESTVGAEATAVSFDLYCSNNISRGVVELFEPVEIGTTSFDKDELHRTLYIREDTWIANFNMFNSDGGGRGVKFNYSAQTWYHFDIWVDYSLGNVKYYMDGTLIGEAALTDGFDAVGGMRYSFSDRGSGGVHYVDNVQILDFIERGKISGFDNIKAVPKEFESGIAFDFDESKNELGYIYDGNTPEFCIDLLNGTSKKQKVRLNLEITDESDTAEDGCSNVYELEPHSVKEVRIRMDTNKFGFHTLKTELFVSGSSPVFSENITFSTANMPKNVTSNPQIGICAGLANGTDGYGGFELQRMAKLVSKAGFKNMRTGVSMEHMSLATLDDEQEAYRNYAPKYGSDTLFILSTVDKCLPVTDAEKEEWRQYVIDVVNEFGHIVDKYEVWNEFNVPAYNKNGASNSDYVEICRIAKEVIDELDPEAIVYGGAAANVEIGGGYDQNTIDFIKDIFYNLEGYKYMDGISIHTYLDGMPERSLEEYASTPKDKLIFELQEWLTEIGYPEIPVISSEIGFAGRDEERAAVHAVRYFLIHTEDLDEVYCYRINNLRFDKSELGDASVQNTFGLIREDLALASTPYPAYSAKPAFLAMCNYNTQLAEAELISRNVDNDRLHYQFTAADGDEVHVVWMRQGSGEITIVPDGKIAEIYDLYGNIINTAEANEGSITVELSTSPVYVRLKNPEPFYVYSDINTNRVWIKGRTAANEQVAAALIDNNNIVPLVREARQILSNSNGTYSICLNAGDSTTWNNYILRVGFEGNEATQEKEYVLPLPKLSVTSNENAVTLLENLSENDSITAVLSDITGNEATKAMLAIITYSEDDKLTDVKIKDFRLNESEVSVTDTVEDIEKIRKIKIIAWQRDTMCPMLAAYTIE